MINKILEKYNQVLMIYDCGENYGVWLAPIQFILLDKETLDIKKSIYINDASEYMKTPLLEVDDSDTYNNKIKESI